MTVQQKTVSVALFSRTQTHVALLATEQRFGMPARPGFDFMFFTECAVSLPPVAVMDQCVARGRGAGEGEGHRCPSGLASVTCR